MQAPALIIYGIPENSYLRDYKKSLLGTIANIKELSLEKKKVPIFLAKDRLPNESNETIIISVIGAFSKSKNSSNNIMNILCKEVGEVTEIFFPKFLVITIPEKLYIKNKTCAHS